MKPFSEFLSCIIGRMGRGPRADQVGIDASQLSRFRSSQGTLPLAVIDKIFEVAEAVIISKGGNRMLEDAMAVAVYAGDKTRFKKLAVWLNDKLGLFAQDY